MPHLLHHLGVEANAKVVDPATAKSGGSAAVLQSSDDGMDWGTLAVYTCPASCPIDAAQEAQKIEVDVGDGDNAAHESRTIASYVEEFIWRQPPP